MSKDAKTNPLPLRWILAAGGGALALIAVLVLAPAFAPQNGSRPVASVAIPGGPTIGGDFTLTAHTGERVALNALNDKPKIVFFGFTHCPDICPLALQSVDVALDILGPEDAAQFQPVFVTLDPERDDPESLAQYVGLDAFPDELVGFTGEPDEIAAVAKSYKVIFEKNETPESAAGYLIDHTSIIYLMNGEGEFVKPFTHGSTPTEIAAGLSRFLKENRPRT